MRLLAFLTTLEDSLRSKGRIPSGEVCARQVDYTRGTARMRMDAGHTVVLTLFRLASGRSCLRVGLETERESHPILSLYPEADTFNWEAASENVVRAIIPLLLREPTEAGRSANVVNA